MSGRSSLPPATAFALTIALAAPLHAGADRGQKGVDRLRIDSFSPPEVSYLGKTPFEIRGDGFDRGTRVLLGGVEVAATRVDAQTLQGIVPPDSRAAGAVELSVVDSAGNVATLRSAFVYLGPLQIEAAIPRQLAAGEDGEVTLRGVGFTLETRFRIVGEDGAELEAEIVSFATTREMFARVPALSAGRYALVASDVGPPEVSHRLPEALLVTSTLQINGFTPGEVSYLGGAEFTLSGRGFTDRTEVWIEAGARADRRRSEITEVTDREIRGRVPPSPAVGDVGSDAPATVEVVDAVGGRVVLADAFRYLAPFVIRELAPERIPVRLDASPTTLSISGNGFTASTRVWIDGDERFELLAVQFEGPHGLTASLPPMAPGSYQVELEDRLVDPPRDEPVRSMLNGALRVIAPIQRRIAPPSQIETDLAGGLARFRWTNGEAYDRIRVRLQDGSLLALLDGDATELLVDAEGSEEVFVTLQGEYLTGVSSDVVAAVAAYLQCHPPAVGKTEGPPLDDELLLLGGHAPAAPSWLTPCAGASGVEADGFDGLERPSQLTTAFCLVQPADRLEVEAHYRKLDSDFGLELRGLLRRVSPGAPFALEFVFPEVSVTDPAAYHKVDVLRTAASTGEPCDEPIPAGDYVLHLYAVGGQEDIAYYAFGTYSEPGVELVFPGTPCPPYPTVRVRDRSGTQSLPVITAVGLLSSQPRADGTGLEQAFLGAFGHWFDSDGTQVSISPLCSTCGEDYYLNPYFTYEWTIFDRVENPATFKVGEGGYFVVLSDVDYGCYRVKVRAIDQRCGDERESFAELVLLPGSGVPPLEPERFTLAFPAPDPQLTTAVIGLDPPAGDGQFDGERPLRFRILVYPPSSCGASVYDCPAAVYRNDGDRDFVVRLAHQGVDTGAEILVDDKGCDDLDHGPKYFNITVEDLGSIAPVAGTTKSLPFSAEFEIRSVRYNSALLPCAASASPSCWQPFAQVRLVNPPDVLSVTSWSGSYEETTDSYHFVLFPEGGGEQVGDMAPTEGFPITTLPVPVNVPSFQNVLRGGFSPRFKFQNLWLPESSSAVGTGKVFGAMVPGSTYDVEPDADYLAYLLSYLAFLGQSGAAGQAKAVASPGLLPSFDWCCTRTLFEESIRQVLFESILYQGTIGPVPVTVTGKISLGIDMALQTLAEAHVSPFDLSEKTGADLWFRPGIDFYLPAEISTEIFFGVASFTAGLTPSFNLDTIGRLGSEGFSYSAKATLSLDFDAEACIDLYVKEICHSTGFTILEGKTLWQGSTNPLPGDFPACASSSCGEAPGAARKSALDLEPADRRPARKKAAGTSGGFPLVSVWGVPHIAVSPDGKVVIRSQLLIEQNAENQTLEPGTSTIVVEVEGKPTSTELSFFGARDPVADFLTNDEAVVVWTRQLTEAEIGGLPPPVDLASRIERTNLIMKENDLVMVPLHSPWFGGAPQLIPLTDEQPGADGRCDGSADIAVDHEKLVGWVSWVRYETVDFVALDPVTPCQQVTLVEEQLGAEPPETCAGGDFLCNDGQCVGTVPNYQPRLDQTAIYVRPLQLAGPIGASLRLSPPQTINISPSISFAPHASEGMCVWLHRAGERTLSNTNRGREILFSRYDGAAWSAAQAALPAHVLDPLSPGVEEPRVRLETDSRGLLIYTALLSGSDPADLGLTPASRHLYLSWMHRSGGSWVFDTPIRIRGACEEPIFVHKAVLDSGLITPAGPPALIEMGDDFFTVPSPYNLFLNTSGPLGTRAGVNDVQILPLQFGATLEDASTLLNLTSGDDHQHLFVSGAIAMSGEILTATMDSGVSALSSGAIAKGIGGDTDLPHARFERTLLRPDLELERCQLSFANAAPGATVTAKLAIVNRGPSSSAVDSSGASATSLQLIHVPDDGDARTVLTQALPVLAAGERHELEVELLAPLDPVRLVAVIDPNPGDSNLGNDSKTCFFGAPSPRDPQCVILPGDPAGERHDAFLTWTNPIDYGEVLVYRDGVFIGTTAGAATTFVDRDVPRRDHRYALRGRIEASLSSSTSAACEVLAPPLPEAATFRRGDANSDGAVDIGDAVAALFYIFLGRFDTTCLDALDTDDSGAIDVSDPIFSLSYQFLGQASPPEPGPGFCGEDPTGDALGCEEDRACSP